MREALAAAVDDVSRYPDGSAYRLKRALAAQLNVEPAQITIGNGSNDVLELAAKVAISPGCRGVVDAHCFVVYPLAITAASGTVVRVPSQAWGHDLAAMAKAVDENTRIVYVANPNNPTGTCASADALGTFLERVPRTVWVVVDEAYAEYASGPDYPNGVALLDEFPNLIVTRTFSKIYGLAALRIGYALSSLVFADLMNRVRQPFNANSLALAAAEAALGDEGYVAESRRLNVAGMAQIERGLTALGLDWIPSHGNFITFEAERDGGPSASAIYDTMLDDGVIVRPVANYGMPRHLRATIGLPAENERFLAALARAIEGA